MPPRDYTTPTLDPIEDITRRRLLTALPALGLIAGGISCGDDDDDEATPTEAPTRTFTDSLGRTVEIPPKPQRIVSLHVYTSAPALLSIGAPVLGIPLDRGVVDAIQPYDLSNIIDVGGFEPNLEAIASLDPDLIIGLAGADGRPAVEDGVAEQIESIAPTVWLALTLSNEEYMQAIGETTGLEQVVERQAAEYRARLDRVRSARSDWSDLSYASIYSFGGTTLGVESPINGNSIVQVLESLNLRPLPEADDVAREGRRFFELSFEELRRVDADVVLWFKDGTDLTTLANWSSLASVQAGQAHSYPAFGASSYPTFNRALDFLEPILIEADSDIIDESSWS